MLLLFWSAAGLGVPPSTTIALGPAESAVIALEHNAGGSAVTSDQRIALSQTGANTHALSHRG